MRPFMSAILLLCLAGLVTAADPLIEKLASDDYATRQQASADLRKMGYRSVPILKEAVKHDDIEVRTVAQGLLDDAYTNMVNSLGPWPHVDSLWYDVNEKRYDKGCESWQANVRHLNWGSEQFSLDVVVDDGNRCFARYRNGTYHIVNEWVRRGDHPDAIRIRLTYMRLVDVCWAHNANIRPPEQVLLLPWQRALWHAWDFIAPVGTQTPTMPNP